MSVGTNFAEELPLDNTSGTTNISLSDNSSIKPSMLILSPCIYAKRSSNNAFYSGNIQTKLPDGRYLVRFTDGASKSIEERNIMWLGFWGLPPSTWPRTPHVHTLGALNMNFANRFAQNDKPKGPIPHSTPFHEGGVDADKRGNVFSELGMKSDVSTRAQLRQSAEEINSFGTNKSPREMPRNSQWSENQPKTRYVIAADFF